MGFSVGIKIDSSAYRKRFKGKLKDLDKAISESMRAEGEALETKVKSKIENQTGRLKESMSFKVKKEKSPKGGHVYALLLGQVGKKPKGGWPPYARIWDKGGTIRPSGKNPFGAKKLTIPMKTPMSVSAKIWKSKSSRAKPVRASDVIKRPGKFGLYGTWATKRAILGIRKTGKGKYERQTIFARESYVKVIGDKYLSGTVSKEKKSVLANVRAEVMLALKS